MSKRPGDPGYSETWCIHYRRDPKLLLSGNEACEAGVAYSELGPREGSFKRMPCFTSNRDAPDIYPCAKVRYPTAEEVKAHEGWLDQRMKLLGAVMAGIKPWREAHKGRSATEVVECPACKGHLQLSISSYNGHVHGHCETEGCVSWME